MKERVTYKNPWYKAGLEDTYGKPTYETDAEPTNYKGFLIYHRRISVWDVVLNGTAVTQRAGLYGAQKFIDENLHLLK